MKDIRRVHFRSLLLKSKAKSLNLPNFSNLHRVVMLWTLGASEGKVFQIKSSTPLIFLFSSIACIMWKNVSSYALRQIEKSSFSKAWKATFPNVFLGFPLSTQFCSKPKWLIQLFQKGVCAVRVVCVGITNVVLCGGCVVKRNLPSFPMFLLYQSMFFWDNRGISVKGKSIKPEGDLALIRLRANE